MGGIYHDGNYYAGANANDRAPKSIITNDTAYNSSKSYVAGDWFINGDVLYEVKTACQGITPPNATYYKVKTLHDLKSDLMLKRTRMTFQLSDYTKTRAFYTIPVTGTYLFATLVDFTTGGLLTSPFTISYVGGGLYVTVGTVEPVNVIVDFWYY